LRQGCLRASSANLLDPRVSTEELYKLPTLVQTLIDNKAALSPFVSASQLQKAIGAKRLSEDDPLANLSQLCATALMAMHPAVAADASYSCCQARCSKCGKLFPVPGYKTVGKSTQKCSCCRGDPEGMRIIKRRILALRLGAGSDAWEALRILLRRAVKAGHAEAVNCIALAGSHRQPLSAADLDLAIRSRRAGVLTSVLIRCSPHIVQTCLKSTQRHALAVGTFGSRQETSLVFDDLRCRLLAAHHLVVANRRPEEVAQTTACLLGLRHGLPRTARLLIWQCLSPDMSHLIVSQLTEMLSGIEGLEIKIDW